MKAFSVNFLEILVLGVALASCSTENVQENAPYNSNDLISKSLAACHSKNISEGLLSLEKVMTNEKTNPIYWNALGVCYSLDKQYLKANFYYDIGLESIALYKAADKKQAEASLLNNVALIHMNYKRFNDAYISLKKAEILAPEIFAIQLNLAQIFLEFKYDDKAMAILTKLESNRPGDFDVLYSMALVYSRKNDFEKALLTLSKLTTDQTTHADVAGVYAYNLYKSNQLTEALSIIEKRQKLDGFNERNKMLEKEISVKLDEKLQAEKQAKRLLEEEKAAALKK